MAKRVIKDPKPTGIRLPTELRQRLEAAAVTNERSLTGEMTHRLAQSFQLPEDAVAVIQALRERVAVLEAGHPSVAKKGPDGTAQVQALAETVATLEARLETLEARLAALEKKG